MSGARGRGWSGSLASAPCAAMSLSTLYARAARTARRRWRASARERQDRISEPSRGMGHHNDLAEAAMRPYARKKGPRREARAQGRNLTKTAQPATIGAAYNACRRRSFVATLTAALDPADRAGLQAALRPADEVGGPRCRFGVRARSTARSQRSKENFSVRRSNTKRVGGSPKERKGGDDMSTRRSRA